MLQKGLLLQKSARCFYAIGSATGTTGATKGNIIPFTIPDDASFLSFLVVGGGGGGTTTAYGGGGGSSGTITSGVFPARVLPKTIYLQCGNGGNGGAAATIGNTGSNSYVSIYPIDYASVYPGTVLLIAKPGGAGATTNGTAGTATTVPTGNDMELFGYGNANTIAGVAGSAGSNTASGANVSYGLSIVCGGAGGGHTGFDGGSIVASNATNMFWNNSASTTLINGGLNSGTVVAGSGHSNIDGICPYGPVNLPLYSLGGGGGYGASTGGAGGNGGPGSGGGGGGHGTAAGKGGNGGPGFIIVQWW